MGHCTRPRGEKGGMAAGRDMAGCRRTASVGGRAPVDAEREESGERLSKTIEERRLQ